MAHNLYSKFHDKDMEAHQPKADVRETMKSFYVEVELSGVKEHTEMRLRWTNSRTLLLSSQTARPEIPEEELLETPIAPVTTPAPNDEATITATVHSTPRAEEHEALPKPPPTTPQKPKLLPPHLTIHERSIGEMLRGFSFPVDVDQDATHAKLDAGILRIVVPKIVHEPPVLEAEHGDEKHLLHVPIRVFSHGHETEKVGMKKVEDPVPAKERWYLESWHNK